MIIKKVFFFCVLVCLPMNAQVQRAPQAFNPMAPGAFDPNMSEEELLNQLMKEINDALPEDQRESFWEEVARETERLEEETAHMSQDEKEQYLFNLITEEPKPDEQTAPKTEEKPVIKEEPKVKPKAQIPVEKTQEVMNIISQIAKSIESFLTKAAAFPDFDGKALRWKQKHRITDWQANSWASFQRELNQFVHTLHRFKEKDAKIGFKHLDALLKQEATIQNLKQLQKKLADYESAITVSPFEIAGMSEQTKSAAINTINALTESLYRTKLPEDLQKIIEAFDPTAKKLREEEEKATKEALTRSERQRFEPTVPVRTAGRAPRRDDFALPKLDDFGLTGRPQTPRSSARGTTRPSQAADSKKGASGKGTKGASGEAGSGTKGKDDKKKNDKGKGKAPTENGKKADGAKKPEASAQIKHQNIKSNLDGFRRDVEGAYNAISETPEFASKDELKGYVRATPPTPAT